MSERKAFITTIAWVSLALVSSTPAPCHAQQTFNISGDITSSTPVDFHQYSIRVESSENRIPQMRIGVSSAGHFDIPYLPGGTYQLRVEGPSGDAIVTQTLIPTPMNGHIEVPLPALSPRSKPVSGTVAASTLGHSVPKKAMKQLSLAAKESGSGDQARAIEHLNSALKIDPDFSEAHTNLGAAYVRTGNYPAARTEFETVIRLGPRAAPQYCNLAIVELALNDSAEAEVNLRKALALDSRNPQSNFILGKILATRAGAQEQAVHHLKLGLPEFPKANLVLAQIYARTGQRKDAIEVLSAYKESAPPVEKTRMDHLIQSLR